MRTSQAPRRGYGRVAGALLLVAAAAASGPAAAQPACSSTTPIGCGETRAGTLAVVGETDCFTFTAEAGEAVSITTQEVAGFFQSCWTLYGPGGASLGRVCGQGERTLPDPGTYTIEVSDDHADEAGSYDVGLVVVSATTSACAADIGCGETRAGELALVGESDVHAFTGTAGDAVSLTVQETGGGLAACWELYDPTGLSLGAACGQDERTLAVSGRYTIRVYDDNESQPGTYDLSLVVVSDTAATCAQSIDCGQTLAGEIAEVGESDTYRFASQAGERVSITAQETGGGLAACWELYDPQGIGIAAACGQTEKSLAVAGDYTVRVHAQGEADTGTYRLNLVFVSATPSQCGAAIACGAPAVASIDPVAESDTYRFTAAAGEAVSITAQETGGFLSACWELYDPDGISLGGACGQAEKTLAVGGDYTVRVYDTGDTETGTYDLTVVIISDTVDSCAAPVACGGATRGALTVKGESDTFAFDAVAGETLSVTAQETSGFLGACWEMYDPTGISLGGACGQGEKTAALAGRYTIRVYDTGDTETGTYDLGVVVVSATAGNCGVPIACGATRADALALSGESDTFTFAAAAGEAISVTAQETGGFLAACWELYDPTGLSLGGICGQTEKTLPVAGTYTIRVYDNGESDTGTYDLSVVVLSATAHNCGEPIGCGMPLARTLALTGESDTFAFMAAAGQTFPIATMETAGSLRACWEAYDPAGASLGGRCGEDTRTAAIAGTYTIRVYDQGEDASGSYVVQVCALPATTTTVTSITTTTGPGGTTTTTLLPASEERPLDGRKLLLVDDAAKPAKRRLKMVSKDPRVDLGGGPGTGDDPTLTGGTLRVFTAAGDAFDDTYVLPRDGWRELRRGGGWKFRGGNPVRTVVVKAGRRLKVSARGGTLGHTLGSDPAPVAVVLALGGHRYCLEFGGDKTSFVPGRRWKAKNTLAPLSCPEAGSPAGAFVR